MVALSASTLHAQNNVYAIDDECYELFCSAENKAGLPSFEDSFSKLLHTAREKNDAKAETLSYVLRLSDALARHYDIDVDESLEQLKYIASQKGYMQYFYYGYINAASYYSNSGKIAKSLSLTNEMVNEAKERGDDYGMWSAERFLASLYLAKHDFKAAKEHILSSIDLYNSTTDENILSQGLGMVYLDLAETFNYESDSLKLYVDKSYESAKWPTDTLYYNLAMAKYFAYEGNHSQYVHYRDLCMNNSLLKYLIPNFGRLFACLDSSLKGDYSSAYALCEDMGYSEYKLLHSMAVKTAHFRQADLFNTKLIESLLNVAYNDDASRLAEIDGLMGNDRLNKQLLSKSRALNRVLTISFVLLLLALLTIIIGGYVYTKNIKRERDRAEAAYDIKTKFVKNMRHEIRTPLNAIVGFSQLLGMPPEFISEEERAQYVKYISSNSQMLTMLVDDIIDLSDLESGSYQIAMADCHANDVCRSTIRSFENNVPAGITLSFETDAPDYFVLYSDERRIQQALSNYLTNAMKYTTEGSIVLGLSLSENPGKVTFYVTDTGIGVPAEKAETIFRRFEQIDEFQQGTGLGLPVTSAVAKALGGYACLDKNYGRCSGNGIGSRFLFVLPR